MGKSALKFYITRDVERIYNILSHDEIAPFLFEDVKILHENKDKIKNPNLIYYVFGDEEGDCGIGVCNKFNKTKLALLDIGFIMKKRGKLAFDVCKKALNHLTKSMPGFSFIGQVKRENRHIYIFDRRLGFELIDLTDKHYIVRYKNGRS